MSGPEHYCTYFDSHYLLRGLALHESLARVAPGSVLWALCLDPEAAGALERWAAPTLRPVRLEALEAADPEFAAARPTRSRIEYYFTSTPALLNHLLASEPAVPRLTYLDADLWFFTNPAPLFEELGDDAVAIVPHRFPEALRRLEVYGTYNVGWLTFTRHPEALRCLERWRSDCIEWCYDRVEGDRFADQKYLDSWPERFERVHVLRHRGANAAPWNLGTDPVVERDGELRAGEWPLLFFHFHGFKRLSGEMFDPGLAGYGERMRPLWRDQLFRPYVREMRALERRLAERVPEFRAPWGAVRRTGWGGLSIAKKLLTGQLLRVPIGDSG
jgi:hypothetical protein